MYLMAIRFICTGNTTMVDVGCATTGGRIYCHPNSTNFASTHHHVKVNKMKYYILWHIVYGRVAIECWCMHIIRPHIDPSRHAARRTLVALK